MRRLAALALALAGCASEDPPPPSFGPCTIELDVPGELLGPSCGAAGCHAREAPAADLDLVSPGLETRLRDRPSDHCGGRLIDVARPAHSLLLGKIVADPDCGAPMPLLAEPLSPDEQACLAAWVERVARQP